MSNDVLMVPVTIDNRTKTYKLGPLSGPVVDQINAAAASVALAAAQVVQAAAGAVQAVATFSALPASPIGMYFVLADETKSGAPTLYYFNAGSRYWMAMVKDN